MSEDLFIFAVRNKLRFLSTKGELNAEQLWDVPLRSRDDFNLDSVAKAANRALKSVTEESFVNTDRTPAHTRLEMALDIVKFVIETKLTEEAAAAKRAENKIERDKLVKILAEQEDGKLSKLSEKEIRKRIDALDA